MELKGRKILVVGLGKTGRHTLNFLLNKGAVLKLSDSSPIYKIEEIVKELQSKGVEVEAGTHTDETFLWAQTSDRCLSFLALRSRSPRQHACQQMV